LGQGFKENYFEILIISIFIALEIFSLALLYYNSYLLILFILAVVFIYLFFTFPEFSLITLFLIPITKGTLEENYIVFQTIDLTVVSIILLVFAVFLKYLKGEIKINIIKEFPQVFLSFIFLTLVVMAGGLYTPAFDSGLYKAGRWLVFNVTIFLTALALLQSQDSSQRFLKLLGFSAVIVAGMLLYKLFEYFLQGQITIYILRLSVLNANPIGVARLISIGTVIFFIYANYVDRRLIKYFLYSITIFLFVGLLSTASRGPFLSLIVGLIAFAFIFSQIKNVRLFANGFGIILVIGIIFILMPEEMVRRYLVFSQMDATVNYNGTIQQTSTIHDRLNMWLLCLSTSVDSLKNLLIGLGTGGFSSLFIIRDFRFYPHNIFFEILVELGLVGLSFFIWHIVSIYNKTKDIYKKMIPHKDKYFTMWVISCITFFTATQFSGNINDNRLLWVFIAGMLSYGIEMTNNSNFAVYGKKF